MEKQLKLEGEVSDLTADGKLSFFYLFPPSKWYYNEKQLSHVIKYVELIYKYYPDGLLAFREAAQFINFIVQAFDKFYGVALQLSTSCKNFEN